MSGSRTPLPVVKAEAWNAAEDRFRAGRFLRGWRARPRRSADGQAVDLADPPEYPHPWQVVPQWSATDAAPSGQWVARVRPGACNGYDPGVSMPARDREVQLGTKPESPRGESVDVRLWESPSPWLVMAWRNPLVGGSATASPDGEVFVAPGEGYPAFFGRFGVRLPASGGNIEDPGSGESPEDPRRTRELRACDIVLSMARQGTRESIEVLDLADSATVRISTVFTNDALRARGPLPELRAVPRFVPAVEPDPFDRLYGTAVFPQTDDIHIATVWALSPPRTAPSAAVDAGWRLYAQHHVHWNLKYATAYDSGLVEPDPITLVVPLAGGIAQPIINAILSPTNDSLQRVRAYLETSTYRGRYWSV